VENVKSSLAQWREANRAAHEAEHALFEATMLYTSGRGSRPTDEEMQAARLLRAIASQLFEVVIAQFGRANPNRAGARNAGETHSGSH
jgi:hypothetical protein